MAVPDPAKPDDVVEAILLTVFGGDSLVLHAFVIASWALAWYALAASAHRHARGMYTRVSRTPAAVRSAAAVRTVITALVQAVYLGLSFFVAGHLNHTIRETEGPGDVDLTTWFTPPADPLGDPVFWMWFTVAGILVWCGWWSGVGMDGDITPFHPVAWFLFACGGVAVLVLLPVHREMGVLALVYVVSAVLSLYLPRSCTRVWGRRPA
ncbi:hypothetical protein ACWGHM_01130 [Streptomyces sp. NPDC054904]|uniref:hypothetical protein n=1 Tax=unclassified Streptomyces TaxID=2593676 RepID=UPI002481E261|nr:MULTISPECIES: hypothetical protein [unclassified Streptomyces]MDA5280185.1 hypothetical protein [Streptomyces sp. Isolate_45]MDX2389182.1 hypothetical protein [Streptomyces sp. DK15]